ncbi:MAG: hypothetical protein GWO24_08610, partial [Akkermansiaceae bacterium]|nr:hypothetical protein [Akkermansiaceae bacterium]
MTKLIVPQEGEAGLGATQSEATELALHRQRQRDTAQSIVGALLIVGLLVGILALIAIASWNVKSPS